ncbi:unnamed protein product [Closterium sp. Naga37s-1]|nr:unnamed protein product [Closterium sp. Naga37s-1]
MANYVPLPLQPCPPPLPSPNALLPCTVHRAACPYSPLHASPLPLSRSLPSHYCTPLPLFLSAPCHHTLVPPPHPPPVPRCVRHGQASLVFHHALPLFQPRPAVATAGAVWLFWLAHDALRAAVYAALLSLPLSQWRDALPGGWHSLSYYNAAVAGEREAGGCKGAGRARVVKEAWRSRPAFHRYLLLLLLLHSASAFASLLLTLHVPAALCMRGLAVCVYWALFPPLLYITFLADFFQDEDTEVEDAYYSEMRDAGVFDADGNWD